MIAAVSGPPGAGKTFYTAKVISDALAAGKYVATNVQLRPDVLRFVGAGSPRRFFAPGYARRFEARMADHLFVADTVDDVYRLRLPGRGEGRGVVVLDEAQLWLNSRSWTTEGRGDAVRWFTQHRKLGWDVYLVAQDVEMIDKQVRTLAEYRVQLRNLRRAKLLGIPASPVNLFLAIWYWHGTKNSVARREVFPLSRARHLYDTHQVLDGLDATGVDGAELLWLGQGTDTPGGRKVDARSAAAARTPDVPATLPATHQNGTAAPGPPRVSRPASSPPRARIGDTAEIPVVPSFVKHA